MTPVEFHPEALEDARRASVWYGERSPRAATRFRAELRRVLDFMPLLPEAGAIGPGGTRRLKLQGFPHAVIYRVAKGSVHPGARGCSRAP